MWTSIRLHYFCFQNCYGKFPKVFYINRNKYNLRDSYTIRTLKFQWLRIWMENGSFHLTQTHYPLCFWIISFWRYKTEENFIFPHVLYLVKIPKLRWDVYRCAQLVGKYPIYYSSKTSGIIYTFTPIFLVSLIQKSRVFKTPDFHPYCVKLQ